MESSDSQQQKQQRRKRKDPESRDYKCKCGKSYLSYAAAYTHVKNKHSGDNDFLTNISKPDREKLKRGRPKEKKSFSITLETEKLSIVQEAILQIYEAPKVKEAFPKIILEGNTQVRLDQLFTAYQALVKQIGGPGELNLIFGKIQYGINGTTLTQFIQNINKHFVTQMAVKIIWYINYLFSEQMENISKERIQLDVSELQNKIKDEKSLALWDNIQQIPEIIKVALEKWIKICQRTSEYPIITTNN